MEAVMRGQLLSALLLQVFYGIRSERQSMEQLDYRDCQAYPVRRFLARQLPLEPRTRRNLQAPP